MLRLIGKERFENIIRTWPDFQLVEWADSLEILVLERDSVFWNDFYNMLTIVRCECVRRLKKVCCASNEAQQ